ncbi:MAG: hypothetical protein QM760_05025 [Nibricoccus sp.]
MNSEQHELPTPDELEDIADAMPVKVPLANYRGVMVTLRSKNYSYQEIADWLAEALKVPVKRNQVSYILNTDPSVVEMDEQEEADSDAADERS